MRVLTLSRNYPSENFPHLGIWVEGLVRASTRWCEQRVVAPVPYTPPFPPGGIMTRYRTVPRKENYHGIPTFRPRFLTGPGTSFHNYESVTFGWAVGREVDRVRRDFPFEVIHAHFIYPDGVVAVKLGQRYRVPVVITEHAMWQPWMDDYQRVRRQAIWAAERCTFQIVASRSLRDSVVAVTHLPEKIKLIPIGVDTDLFTCSRRDRNPQRILYVGRVQRVKGVDVLVESMEQVVRRHPGALLTIVGDGLYQEASERANYLKELVDDLDLAQNILFVGRKTQAEVARLMQECAVLVLPSRRESFGTVLLEALACGTPVVATRCGGPEDIVNDEVGYLVPPEDPDLLAEAISDILDCPERYCPRHLSAYAGRFSWSRVAERVHEVYQAAVAQYG